MNKLETYALKMKKLIFLLSILCFSFTVKDSAIPCNVYSGYRVTAADTNEHEIQFCDLATSSTKVWAYVIMDENNSDSIAFSVGATINSNYGKFGPGERAVLGFKNGPDNLRYKADASGDKFKITH